MDPEAFVRWALDDARTLEERYTTELVVERGVDSWNSRRKIYQSRSIDEIIERQRQRALNPAYEPHYTEKSLRRAAEAWTELDYFNTSGGSKDRPIRNIEVLRFFPTLQQLHLNWCEVDDLSPLTALPRLKELHFGSFTCRDYRPLAQCKGLMDLQLQIGKHWPDVRGLADLPSLTTLKLRGNLLVFEGAVFPHVISGALECEPLPAPNLRVLPQLPSCRFLHFEGAETLEGIEAFRELRNLVLAKSSESFEPLVNLPELTCLTVLEHEPTDVSPLARVPKLQFLSLDTWNKIRVRPPRPRDVAPLIESPTIRELHVRGSKVIETEAAAVQAGLPSWTDLYRRTAPRPLPRLSLRAVPWKNIPKDADLPALQPDVIDVGLRECELRWAHRQLNRAITHKLGTSDWGEATVEYPHRTHSSPHIIAPTHRTLEVEFQSFGLLDKFPLFVEAIRECLAWFSQDYLVKVSTQLKSPRLPATPAQIELEEKYAEEQDRASFEQLMRDNEEFVERLHRYELKKQEGAKVNPEEFAPGPPAPFPEPPWERDDAAVDVESGDLVTKEKPEPPPSWFGDDHPLADNYLLSGTLTLECFWIPAHMRGVAEYLMQRGCDQVIEEPKEGSA